MQLEVVDENPDNSNGFYYMMPKTQIMPLGGFEASVTNNGEYELYDVQLNVAINKNHQEQFSASSETLHSVYFGDPADTLRITETYIPVDFGHYEISYKLEGDNADQFPDNNTESYYFHVTDSVFARTPDVSEADESPWRSYYQYTHEGDLMGVEFNPIEDCIASSISVYISRSNFDVDFKFVLLEITEGEGDELEFKELVTTETMWVDSEVLNQGWVTLPLDPDGVGEYLKAGGRYIAAVQFWTYIEEDDLINRGDAFWIGSTQSYPGSYNKQWLYESYTAEWTQGSNYNKMIRLNIDNHENIIDGISNSLNTNSLSQNYPNPFSTQTSITYNLARDENVTIEIMDLTGRTIAVLQEGFRSAGTHTTILSKDRLDAGLYFYTLTVGRTSLTKKMTIK